MLSKRCFKCLSEKPLSDFYKHAQMSDGHLNKCKECTRLESIKNRLDKIEYYRAYDKARASQPKRVLARKHYTKTESWKISHAKSAKKWASIHPNRRKANVIVGNAVRDGKLNKHPCFICGNTNVQGHHPDYDRPLDVIWLCVKHHKETHKIAYELDKAA